MNNKRTNVDFSKHIIEDITEGKTRITKFKDPTTSCYAITFINSCGVLAVTGDCGNWIFCREFHPSKDGAVSDGYWCEKLRIASTQVPAKFDSDLTRKEIEERLTEEELSEEDKEYLKEILEDVDECEERYFVYAYDRLPSNRDFEFIPSVKSLNPMLEVVFDAFDEICSRMKDNL